MMIKKIILSLAVLFFSSQIVIADIELTTTLNSYNDQYLSSSNGLKLNYIFDGGIYLSAGYTGYSELRYGGQDTAEVFIYSLSLGMRGTYDFNKSTGFVYVQAGYYQPYFNKMTSYEEAFGYRHYELLHGVEPEHRWQKYDYALHAGMGGEIGTGIEKDISQTVNIVFFGAYRVLKLREVIRGWGPGGRSKGHWKTRNDKDFGGFLVGVGLKKEF